MGMGLLSCCQPRDEVKKIPSLNGSFNNEAEAAIPLTAGSSQEINKSKNRGDSAVSIKNTIQKTPNQTLSNNIMIIPDLTGDQPLYKKITKLFFYFDKFELTYKYFDDFGLTFEPKINFKINELIILINSIFTIIYI